MPSEAELKELALQIFFEENPQATTNPEEYELRAPEGHYYILAKQRAMSGIKEDLYKALQGYQQETETILSLLEELGEHPEYNKTDEELAKQVTSLENKLSRTETALFNANADIDNLSAEKSKLDDLLAAQKETLKAQPEKEKPKEPELTEEEEEEEKKERSEKKAERLNKAADKGILKLKPKEVKNVTEKTLSEGKTRRLSKKVDFGTGTSKHQIATSALLHMFDGALHILEETMRAGKLNPAQGLIGMSMIADLLHGGAYKANPADRPAMGGKNAFYYEELTIENGDLYPIRGFNILDPIGSFFGIENDANASKYAQEIITEIYLNSNVPHVFPKLLSDEAYAKIQMMVAYLSHSAIVQESASGVKTFVEASAIPVEAISGAIQRATPSGEQLKQLMPLLSLLTP